jgi:hypothetical protein
MCPSIGEGFGGPTKKGRPLSRHSGRRSGQAKRVRRLQHDCRGPEATRAETTAPTQAREIGNFTTRVCTDGRRAAIEFVQPVTSRVSIPKGGTGFGSAHSPRRCPRALASAAVNSPGLSWRGVYDLCRPVIQSTASEPTISAGPIRRSCQPAAAFANLTTVMQARYRRLRSRQSAASVCIL